MPPRQLSCLQLVLARQRIKSPVATKMIQFSSNILRYPSQSSYSTLGCSSQLILYRVHPSLFAVCLCCLFVSCVVLTRLCHRPLGWEGSPTNPCTGRKSYSYPHGHAVCVNGSLPWCPRHFCSSADRGPWIAVCSTLYRGPYGVCQSSTGIVRRRTESVAWIRVVRRVI